MMGQLVKVRRETLAACMTCPLCNKLLKEATTISLCLHTFCRKCIYGKLSDEEVDYCPVCEIDLGCIPEEKLRPDHNLQDIRAKIFPIKGSKVKTPEAMPSISLPVKRKERSLSSLVVNTPKVPIQTGLTGRRTKAAKKSTALRGPSFSILGPVKNEKDNQEISSSSESLNEIAPNKWQNSSLTEPSNDKESENNVNAWEGKADLWTPLNCLLEAANRTKYSNKYNSLGPSTPKSELLNTPENELFKRKNKFKSEDLDENKTNMELGQKWKVEDDKNAINFVSGPVKRRRLRTKERKREANSGELFGSAQFVLDNGGINQNRRNYPIWFSLVASEDQKGDSPLPQISGCYLRIKDGKLPVSIIQKYLVKKLNLTSETEVDITCQGQIILPTLQLHDLVDLWLQTTSTSRVPATVGTSAKDFMMVLLYSQRTAAPA